MGYLYKQKPANQSRIFPKEENNTDDSGGSSASGSNSETEDDEVSIDAYDDEIDEDSECYSEQIQKLIKNFKTVEFNPIVAGESIFGFVHFCFLFEYFSII